MKYKSPPKGFETLTSLLAMKGLVIDDITSASRDISLIGFFRFKRYSVHYHVSSGVNDYSYLPNTHLAEILDTYRFDCFLRALVFEAIGNIEVAFKSLLNNAMTLRFGSHWYLNKTVFTSRFTEDLDESYQSNYEKFIYKITKECDETKEAFVRRYKLNYNEPSLPTSWIILEIMSFGTCSILYENIESTEARDEISSAFGSHQKAFATWLKSLGYLRNQCAHHHKIIGRTFMFPPQLPKKSSNRFLNDYTIQSDSLYAALCIIQYCLQTLNIPSFFKQTLLDLISENPDIDLNKLGFTSNWQKEKIWQ
ncbi:MAG: Abi family protein [Ferruginibacter sp.]